MDTNFDYVMKGCTCDNKHSNGSYLLVFIDKENKEVPMHNCITYIFQQR